MVGPNVSVESLDGLEKAFHQATSIHEDVALAFHMVLNIPAHFVYKNTRVEASHTFSYLVGIKAGFKPLEVQYRPDQRIHCLFLKKNSTSPGRRRLRIVFGSLPWPMPTHRFERTTVSVGDDGTPMRLRLHRN